jgi:ADP-ribose pyrophosphatase YjhB (NUDIX family)
MIPGRDYIGVGVGAMVFNQEGKVFLAQRGPEARNEQGTWEFPGGMVGFGEKLLDAIKRELLEEYDMEIEIIALLCVTDHILISAKEHWVSTAFLARHVSGIPVIRELGKCTHIGWFDLGELPEPLSLATLDCLSHYYLKSD